MAYDHVAFRLRRSSYFPRTFSRERQYREAAAAIVPTSSLPTHPENRQPSRFKPPPQQQQQQQQQSPEGVNIQEQVMGILPTPQDDPDKKPYFEGDSPSELESSEVIENTEAPAQEPTSATWEGVAGSLEFPWRKMMEEAWFGAIPFGWGPGSPVWDQIDGSNNPLLHPNLPIPTSRPQDFDSSHISNKHTTSASSSSSSSYPMNMFFWKEGD